MNLRQHPNVMIMGDFNDYPTNNSIAKVLGAVAPKGEVQAKKLYNLMDGRKEEPIVIEVSGAYLIS